MITVNRQLAGALDAWRRGLPLLIVGRGALSLAIRLAGPRERLRAPHYTVGNAGLASEIDRAAGGVLLLDEAPEFSQQALESVRQAVLTGSPRDDRGIRLILTISDGLFRRRSARDRIRAFAPFAGVVRTR